MPEFWRAGPSQASKLRLAEAAATAAANDAATPARTSALVRGAVLRGWHARTKRSLRLPRLEQRDRRTLDRIYWIGLDWCPLA